MRVLFFVGTSHFGGKKFDFSFYGRFYNVESTHNVVRI